MTVPYADARTHRLRVDARDDGAAGQVMLVKPDRAFQSCKTTVHRPQRTLDVKLDLGLCSVCFPVPGKKNTANDHRKQHCTLPFHIIPSGTNANKKTAVAQPPAGCEKIIVN